MWSWKNLRARWSTPSIRQPRRGRQRPTRLLLEQLEARTLLTSPASITQNLSISGADQFTGQVIAANTSETQSNDTFLGGTFGGTISKGSIDHTPIGDYGAQGSITLNGKAGLDVDFTATSGNSSSLTGNGNFGSINANYGATLTQGFNDPQNFGDIVSFNPTNTYVTNNSGGFTTASPSFGYGTAIDLGLHGNVQGTFAAFTDYGGSKDFGGDLTLPLFSVNENNSGEVKMLDVPILAAAAGGDLSSTMGKLKDGLENFGLGYFAAYGISTAPEPPLRVKMNLSSSQPLSFTQDLQLQLGVPDKLGPYTSPLPTEFTADVGLDLGSITEKAPKIDLTSGGLQGGGVVSASGSDTIAQLSIQTGPLAAYALDIPGLAVLGDTSSISLGPATVNFTPVSFQLQPTLYASQTATFRPVNTLTYSFTKNVGGNIVTATPDVILDGVDQGPVSSVTFTPGVDTVGIRFFGKTIVTPTWNFQGLLNNEVDLNAGLDATLTVGELTASVPGVDTFTLGPLYQQQFSFANTKLESLFNNTVTLFNQSVTGASFTIGAGFPLSTNVTTTDDGLQVGTLRHAILSADSPDLSSTTQAIQLGAGTYHLTLPPTGAGDGLAGNLVVSANHLTIVGAGANQTIIDATGLGDRVLHELNGGGLTLVGVTIKGGSPNGSGGGILADAGSSLDIEHSEITGNTATTTGGGIRADGLLTINDSTIDNNTVTAPNGANGANEVFNPLPPSIIHPATSGTAGGDAQGGGVYVTVTGGALDAGPHDSIHFCQQPGDLRERRQGRGGLLWQWWQWWQRRQRPGRRPLRGRNQWGTGVRRLVRAQRHVCL
jgi:hypothetical protein